MPNKPKSQRVSVFDRWFFSCALRASQNCGGRIRGLHECKARAKVELDRMRRLKLGVVGLCTTLRSRARLYMDAVSMAKPRRRDVMGKENNSTSYEPSEVRCAFVFFFFSPSRGQIFGLSAQRKRYAHTMSTAHGVARLFAHRRGAGERLNARQVEQKKPFRRSTCK